MIESIKLNLYMIKKIYRYSRLLVIISFALACLSALPVVLTRIYLVKEVLNSLQSEHSRAVEAIVITSITVIVYEIINVVYNNFLFPAMYQKAYKQLQLELYNKAADLDIKHYDDPKSYDRMILSLNTVDSKMGNCLTTFSFFISNLSKLLLTSVAFVSIGGVYLAVVVLSFVSAVVLSNAVAKTNAKESKESISHQRALRYYDKVYSDVAYAKEMRLSNLNDLILNKISNSYKGMLEIVKRFSKVGWKLSFLQITVSGYILGEFVIMLLLGYNIIVKKQASVGDFTAIYSGVDTILASLFSLIGPMVANLTQNAVFIEKYKEFLETENSILNGADDVDGHFQSLNIKDVSFSYENKNEILNELSVSIENKKNIAIVGMNGAGKSTLIKLILRLYDPNAGAVYYNDKNIKEYRLDSYRQNYSCIFQNFKIYAFSVGENIALNNDIDTEKAINALNSAKIFENSNEAYLNNNMTKNFCENGIILSGGESQRLALSRVFYKNSQIVIMDEPSASLDPVNEYKFNNVILEEFSEKTVIIISHRLSTVRKADVILFLKDGRIAERGSHSQLLEMNGDYAKMWKIQTEKFK